MTAAKCRDAGFAAAIILLLVAYFGERLNLVLPAIIVLVVAMLFPRLFKPWAYLWWGLARLTATVGSKLVLTVVYMVVLTPMGLFRRLIGADPMRRREFKGPGSVFVERDGTFRADDLETPY